eukprot:13643840-Ditylum_brightwellii.AAC.1
MMEKRRKFGRNKEEKNEGFEIEEMKEKDGEEGMGRTINENMYDEEINIHDKEEEEDSNDEIMVDEYNADQINTINLST